MDWTWWVQGYYASDVQPPKVPGELAIEIGGESEEALDMDVKVLQLRPDIGEIVGPFRWSR